MFELHRDRLLAYCLRTLESRAEAEDAVQTTFLYAHRALQRGVVPESEYAWLHAIARNVCRWQLRSAARRRVSPSEIDLDALPARANGRDEAADLVAALPDALASLPEGQRQAIVLRELRGLAPAEIARLLEISPPAAHALLTRARRSLAHALTTATRRPVLGLDFGSLMLKLKGLLAGGTAKAVATTVAAAGVAVGTVAIERSLDVAPPGASGPAVVQEAPAAGASRTETSLGVRPQPADVVRGVGTTPGVEATGTPGGDAAVTPGSGEGPPEAPLPVDPAAGPTGTVPSLPPGETPPLPSEAVNDLPLVDPPAVVDELLEPLPEDLVPPLPVDLPEPIGDGPALDEALPDPELPPPPPLEPPRLPLP